MSALSNSQVSVIQTRDNVDSLPLRDNFAEIKAAINDNWRVINDNATPGGSEVVNARDNFPALVDNIRARKQYGNRVNGFTDLQVVENSGGATDNVQVSTGDGIVNGVGVTKTSVSTSGSISAASAGNHRRDVVVIDSANSISILSGAEVLTSATPPYPSIAQGEMPLGEFIIDETSPVVVADADITDSRLPAIDPFNGIEYFGASATYTADNNLDVLTYTDRKGNDITFTHSYNSDNNISSIVVAYLSITVTNTITYDSSGNIESQTKVLSA